MLSDAVLYGVRTFLDPAKAGPQLPDQPEEISSYTRDGHASTSKHGKGWSFQEKTLK